MARRDLPWRQTRDPWAILVSEVMLAQTQVGRVIPRWQEFMARWPTADACAAAPMAEVIGAWSGLGYNRRAVFLHRAAVAITTRHQGVIPADRAALVALPGVGPYTARAVLAFAFGQPVGMVETNAARVLARAVAGRRLTAWPSRSWPTGWCRRVRAGPGTSPCSTSGPWSARPGAPPAASARSARRPATGRHVRGSARGAPTRPPARPAPRGRNPSSRVPIGRVGRGFWPVWPTPPVTAG